MEVMANYHYTKMQPILDEMEWLKSFIDFRIKSYFDSNQELEMDLKSMPDITYSDTPYAQFVLNNNLNMEERVVLLMSMVPLIQPHLFDCFYIQNSSIGRPFSEFGGIELKGQRGFIPTAETVSFVLYGKENSLKPNLFKIFSEVHVFAKSQVLELKKNHDTDTFWTKSLRINEDFFYHLISGEEMQPKYSSEFPAKKLETQLEYEDLVLNKQLKEEISHILTWVKFRDQINQDKALKKNFKAGYRALFYGPPGTGKSLTAAMLGKISGRPVYRIDLSKVVSKYIGETEKNLSTLLDIAEHKNWLLFFDEADSLFSKRTEINDSKDKYANQGTAYLLQRLEEYDGLVILATNLKPNIDRAFVRRFQTILYFHVPTASERLVLWQNSLKNIELSPQVDLKKIADKYELTGAAICNAIQFAWLNSRKNNKPHIEAFDIEAGVIREISKEGKTVKE